MRRTATLIVKKVVVNNIGNPLISPADFIMHINGNNPSPTDFPGSVAGELVFLVPGTVRSDGRLFSLTPFTPFVSPFLVG
jgi:hypothetical protein